MAKVKVSTEIKAPVERVFELFTDIEHAAERVAGIKKIEVMSTGPFSLGYRWTETREVMGRLDSARMEISSFERNRTYTMTHHKGEFSGVVCASIPPSCSSQYPRVRRSVLSSSCAPRGCRRRCCCRSSGRLGARSAMCSATIWLISRRRLKRSPGHKHGLTPALECDTRGLNTTRARAQLRRTRMGLRFLVKGVVRAGALKANTDVGALARIIEAVLGGSMLAWAFDHEGLPRDGSLVIWSRFSGLSWPSPPDARPQRGKTPSAKCDDTRVFTSRRARRRGVD
jgi:polyketide cyclase/dehydrase/lipid transport protein